MAERGTDQFEAPRRIGGRRYNFAFAFAVLASFTGLCGSLAAIDVASGKGELESTVKVLTVLVVLAAWLIFQAGYSRYYRSLCYLEVPAAGGLNFPGVTDPDTVDFMYFGFSVGATFGASDVTVTSRAMRWHVLVHSVLAFLYNAAVVATTVAMLTSVT